MAQHTRAELEQVTENAGEMSYETGTSLQSRCPNVCNLYYIGQAAKAKFASECCRRLANVTVLSVYFHCCRLSTSYVIARRNGTVAHLISVRFFLFFSQPNQHPGSKFTQLLQVPRPAAGFRTLCNY